MKGVLYLPASLPREKNGRTEQVRLPRRIGRAPLLCLALLALGLLAGCGKTTIAVPTVPSNISYAQSGKAAPIEVKSSVVSTARGQIGTPYRKGGQTPGGFDCSGLVSWIYGQHGIQVPRTTAEQTRMGRKVERASLQAGDVLVFRTRSGLHTGIYTGRGTFIHSPKAGDNVREDELNNIYWTKAYREARRLL